MNRKQELQKELARIKRAEKADSQAIGKMFTSAGMNRFQAQALLELYEANKEAWNAHIEPNAIKLEQEHKARVLPKIQAMNKAKKKPQLTD